MVDQDQGLSSDLEWLLQSGQVSQEELLTALAAQYLLSIYRLALAVWDDPAAARLAARETFSRVLLNLYRYSSQIGVERWLYGLALDAIQQQVSRLKTRRMLAALLPRHSRTPQPGRPAAANEAGAEVWRAFDALDEMQRIPVFLFYVQGLQAPQIASLMQSRQFMAGASNAQLIFLGNLKGVGQEQEAGDLHTQLASSLQARWSTTDSDLAGVTGEILDQAQRRSTTRRTVISFKEILLVGATILLAVGLIWRSNIAQPEPSPTIAAEEKQPIATPLPGTAGESLSTPEPTGAPLGLSIPTAVPTSTPTPQGVLYYVQPGDTLIAIAAQMGIPVDELYRFNRLAPETVLKPGMALVNPRSLTSSLQTIATPVPPFTPVPLRLPPSSAEINQYLQDILQMKLWKSVWFDALLVYYGPSGYIGPQQTYRVQAWVGKQQFLIVGGPPQGPPDQVILMSSNRIYTVEPGLNQPWYTPANQSVLYKSPLFDTFAMLMVADPLRLYNIQDFHYQSLGSELENGKEMAVVDQTDLYGDQNLRMWLDEQGGFILRQQHFANSDPKQILKESRVTAIAYNVDFPEQLLDPEIPWRGGFAMDYTGRPEPASPTPSALPTPNDEKQILKFYPPANFDPSKGPLTFGFPSYYNHFSLNDEYQRYFDTKLFADGFYIGELQLSDPYNMFCARSPDGKRIAFSNVSMWPFLSSAPLHWFSLSDQGKALALSGDEDLLASDFAFAPDSRHLAIIGGTNSGAGGKIYLLDTDTGSSTILLDALGTPFGASLVWSPDGQYLAFLGLSEPGAQERPQVVVMRIENWQVTDRYQFELGASAMQASLPFPSNWMGKFPNPMGGLEACAQPPVENK
jgi:DNA-directed RNA polymerase specialized sigma24 family protein/LysM repeat protein